MRLQPSYSKKTLVDHILDEKFEDTDAKKTESGHQTKNNGKRIMEEDSVNQGKITKTERESSNEKER